MPELRLATNRGRPERRHRLAVWFSQGEAAKEDNNLQELYRLDSGNL